MYFYKIYISFLDFEIYLKILQNDDLILLYTAKSAEHMTCSERVQNMFKMCS